MKESILQCAIQGQLTEKLTSDGDARELIKEIKKGGARLIKEGKIRKDKLLPEIEKDEIHLIFLRIGAGLGLEILLIFKKDLLLRVQNIRLPESELPKYQI